MTELSFILTIVMAALSVSVLLGADSLALATQLVNLPCVLGNNMKILQKHIAIIEYI